MVIRTSMLLLVFGNFLMSVSSNQSPKNCVITSGSVLDLSKCFDQFMKPANYITLNTWTQIKPSSQELFAWYSLVQNVLNFNSNLSCFLGVQIPPILYFNYAITDFHSTYNNQSYCLVYEYTVDAGKYFLKGWGWFIAPKIKDPMKWRFVYYGVPHPKTDGPVQHQSAALFERTEAIFLHVPGMQRNSYQVNSSCQPNYYITDGAHNIDTAYHITNKATRDWHFRNFNHCPWNKCAFLQLHGKFTTSCVALDVFLSAGIQRTKDSLSRFYNNTELPINRLQRALTAAGISEQARWNIGTTKTSECHLRATDNVFGRLLNGVTEGNECTQAAANFLNSATGHFVHVEQSLRAREASGYDIWEAALKNAFDVW